MDAHSCQRQSYDSYASNEEKIVRPTADFPPSAWGDYFISFPPSPYTVDKLSLRMEELKMEVKAMFDDLSGLAKTLSLVDDIQRLGLERQFEKEIDESLRRIQGVYGDAGDMHIVALGFRLLRQHGYNISSDVFDKYKDDEGKFKQELSCDAKGLLNLYEASWLGTREEMVLDEALSFSRSHMEHHPSTVHTGNVLAAQIKRALEMPFHRGLRQIEARHYIKIYPEVDESSEVLLELAKLHCNLVQSQQLAELKALSIWWRELGLLEKLGFGRDRVVECHFWTSGAYFEPKYTTGRLIISKMLLLLSTTDDMFDAYGTVEELQLLTDVIQRWDLENAGRLPNYMRVYLDFLKSFIKEAEDELARTGRLHLMHHLIESVKACFRAFFEEAKWAGEDYTPTLDEYIHTSIVSACYPLIISFSHIIMDEEVVEDVLDWYNRMTPVVEASSLIGRLTDDVESYKYEQKRKHVASAVQCYMNDNVVTEQEACAEIKKIVANAWKDMNKEWLNSCSSKKQFNMIAIDYARVIEVVYKHGDGYTDPWGDMKENLNLLLTHQYKIE